MVEALNQSSTSEGLRDDLGRRLSSKFLRGHAVGIGHIDNRLSLPGRQRLRDIPVGLDTDSQEDDVRLDRFRECRGNDLGSDRGRIRGKALRVAGGRNRYLDAALKTRRPKTNAGHCSDFTKWMQVSSIATDMQAGAQPAEPKYRCLSAAERDQIANMKAAGRSNAEIARVTGRSDGTITRELQRNSSPNDPSPSPAADAVAGAAALVYCANAAHEQACQRAMGHRTRDPLKNEFLRGYVEEKLRRLRWTPARIAGRLRHEFGKCYERNLCAETIYEWIYSDDAPTDLRTLLPRKRRQRGQCDRRGKRAGVGKIPERTGIEERPEAVEDRAEAGHFEGDTVIGKQSGAAVHTEVERQSRYMIARIIPNKTAEETLAAMLAIFGEIPEKLRKTLTLDNGTEFVKHMELHDLITTYFARPYHSWERGSNENINGYLRRFFPKGTDFDQVTQAELDQAVELINNMPRRCLDWQTAAEAWATLNKEHQTSESCAGS